MRPDPLKLKDGRDDLFMHQDLLKAGAILKYFVQLPDRKIIQSIKISNTIIAAELEEAMPPLELAVEP